MIGSWISLHSPSRSRINVVGNRAVETGRGRALLFREREEPGPVELGRVEEREQFLMIGFGLAGEADDERRPEGRAGFVGADLVDHREEAITAPPPLHASQQRRRRVLQREVEVRDDGVELEHRRDERVLHFRGIQIEESHAPEAGGRERVEPAQQRCECARRAGVAPVPREVLRDEHELRNALLHERARFGFDRFGSS